MPKSIEHIEISIFKDTITCPPITHENFKSFKKEWQYLGIAAHARIVVNSIIQTISAGMVIGVESDVDNIEELIEKEQETLVQILLELGFTTEEISAKGYQYDKTGAI